MTNYHYYVIDIRIDAKENLTPRIGALFAVCTDVLLVGT